MRLHRAITEAGCLPMAGQIVDATLVAAPRQRNTEDTKARIELALREAALAQIAPETLHDLDLHALERTGNSGGEAAGAAAGAATTQKGRAHDAGKTKL